MNAITAGPPRRKGPAFPFSEGVRDMNQTIILSALLLVVFTAGGEVKLAVSKVQTETPDVSSGKRLI